MSQLHQDSMDVDAIPPSSPPHASTMDPPSSPFFEPQYSAFTGLKSSSPPPLFSSDDSGESIDVTNYESPRIYRSKRKGAWWDTRDSTHGSAHTTPESKKKKFSRNFDSGIYMLSDDTDSSDNILHTHRSPFDTAAIHEHDLYLDNSDEQPAATYSSNYPAIAMSASERVFNFAIDNAINLDLEDHEFRNLGLVDQNIHRISDLSQITRNPSVHGNSLPAPGQYRILIPEHKISLSQNQLHRLIPALFVPNITKLYLRKNKIEELPQDIVKLVNLDTLDVAFNKIKYLPFDIVKLLQPHGKLARLNTFANPLLAPMSPERFRQAEYVPEEDEEEEGGGAFRDLDALPLDLVREDAEKELKGIYETLSSSADRDAVVWRIRYMESWANSFDGGDDGRQIDPDHPDIGFYSHHPSLWILDLNDEEAMEPAPRYIARTLVSYYDQAGHLLLGSPSLPTSNNDTYSVIVETTKGTYGTPASLFTPPSTTRLLPLATTSLHSSLKGETPKEHRRLMRKSENEMPRDADVILSRAEENDAGGYGYFRSCHVCEREYVVARAEWIEFWSRGKDVFVPLRVQVCCWGCVPRQLVERPPVELSW